MVLLAKIFILRDYLSSLHFIQTANADEAPEVEWSKTFDFDYDDAFAVQQTKDGGYIIFGEAASDNPPTAGGVWLIKTDSDGNKDWEKTFDRKSLFGVRSGQQTSDGGYIIAGGGWVYENDQVHHHSPWLIKTDSSGNKIWDEKYHDINTICYSVKQTADDGYIMLLDSASLLKTDSSGNKIWEKDFDGTVSRVGSGVIQTTDGGYVIITNIGLIKTDSNGNKQWEKTFGGTSVQQTSDGGYIIIGSSLIKTDSNGNKQWEKTFGGKSVHQTGDGGFIIGGNDVYNMILLKTDSIGNKEWELKFEEEYYIPLRSVELTSDGGYIIVGQKKETNRPDIILIKVESDGNGYQPPVEDEDFEYHKAMYVWGKSSNILENPDEEYNIDSLITFCKEPDNDINTLYFFVNGSLFNNNNLPDLISTAKENNIEIHALAPGKELQNQWGDGAPDTFEDEAVLSWVDAVIAYNDINPSEKFSGIHLDLEVKEIQNGGEYIWPDYKDSIDMHYLELLKKIMENVSGKNLLVGVDLGHDYDNDAMKIQYEGKMNTLTYHVMDIVDFVTIMDYTDDMSLAKSQIYGEMNYAKNNNKNVVVAFETQYLGEDKEDWTFYKEGRYALKDTMNAVWKEYNEFNGFAIHKYSSYKNLPWERGNNDDNNGDIHHDTGTPGFELILVLVGMTLVLSWSRKKRK